MSVYHDLTSYLKATTRFKNIPGKIIDGLGFFLVKGEWVSDEEFFQHNSIPTYAPPEKENPDKKNISQSVKIRKYR